MGKKKQITSPEQLIAALKRQRKSKQISQTDLGGLADLTTATISKIEK